MNPHLKLLQPYPFEKLDRLLSGTTPPDSLKPIKLSIGEPQHAAPEFVASAISSAISGLSHYPTTIGSSELRQSIADWLTRRYNLPAASIDIEQHILPVTGTREALFAIAQCVVKAGPEALVLMPNPFYQIYEGAAFLAGAQPWFLNTTADNLFYPDLDAVPDTVWQHCQLLYTCSPGNPTGAVLDLSYLQRLIALSDRFGFVIASDECYSEIYPQENNPPPGLLQAASLLGRHNFRNCLVFHSLSKRSSLPGMRSGFVAGDESIIRAFRLFRTYHGCAMSLPYQAASARAWSDEEHVKANRLAYRQKFASVLAILSPVMDIYSPDGGFYLWAGTPGDDTTFTKELFARYNLTVLPGSYLSRVTDTGNPGCNHIRMALVVPEDECIEAAERLRSFLCVV